jgi:RHS repeat-associated protein
VDVIAASSPSDNVSRVVKRGEKHYELSNHLGNVLATVSDKKIAVMSGANLSYYCADVVSYSDYYPFGAPMTERTALVTPTDVRYGFQGQEEDDELWSGSVSFKYRVEDARLGRFFSVDPLSSKFPWNSPYAFAENRVIDGIELEGLEYLDADDANINCSQQNDDGTYALSLGGQEFNNISRETIDGHDYYNLGQHMFYNATDGWTATGAETDRATSWPTRPDFDDMWTNLPANNAWNLIGGKVKQNHDNFPDAFANSCAVRMSRALNYSGAPVSPTAEEKSTGRAGTGSDKLWYYYGLTQLGPYMSRTLGAPDETIPVTRTTTGADIERQLQGKAGIILFRVSGWDDAVGHADMWNGTKVKNSGYFNQSGLTSVSIWYLDR